jgi:hypothetical protein
MDRDGNPWEPSPGTIRGIVDQPIFTRLPEPKRPEQMSLPGERKASAWAPIVEKVRQRPFHDAIVAEYKTKRGYGKRAAFNDARSARTQILRYLTRFPLERWRVSQRTVVDSWHDQQIYLTFFGKYTAEEQAAYKARKRRLWDESQERGRVRRAEAEQRARDRAMKQARRRAL